MSMEFQYLIDEEELIMDCERLRRFALRNSLKDRVDEIRDRFIEQEEKKKNDWGWEIESLIYRFAEAIKREI